MTENRELEKECEDAVFQICCTRDRYSTKCANQLEKYINLRTKMMTAKVKTNPIPNFEVPILTKDEEELFSGFEASFENKPHCTKSKGDVRNVLNRVKELKSVLNQIEKSSSTEVHQLIEQ